MWLWRRTAAIALLIALNGWVDCVGQESSPSLLSRQDWVRFDLVLGRVRANHLRAGQGRTVAGSEAEGDVRESLLIGGEPTSRSIRYLRSDSTSSCELRTANNRQVTFTRSAAPGSTATGVRFTQRPGQPILLEVADKNPTQTYRFASLWHLLLAEPNLGRQHVIPFLELLRPDWRLDAMREQVQAALFDCAGSGQSPARQDIDALITQLGSRDFAHRQAADRELRNHGIAVLPYLQTSGNVLNGEQRLRVSRIRERLTVATSDTPVRVATWLANDKAIWLGLLAHDDAQKRKLAAARFSGIHAGPVLFDPLADEPHRRQQIAALRSELAGTRR